MKRRLWLLNLALAAAVAALGWQLRTRWLEARTREQAVSRPTRAPAPPPIVTPAPPVPPISPAAYLDTAKKLLFAKDRSSTVVIETAPPKPMPSLPIAYGLMDVGFGPTALMSEKRGSPQESYKAGDQIGAFKLIAVNAREREVVLEWEGGKVTKKVDDLMDKTAGAPAQEAVQERPAAPAAPVVTPVSAEPVRAGPGASMGGEVRACVAGDSSPAGTVLDGLKKVVSESPFGKICRWEPVK